MASISRVAAAVRGVAVVVGAGVTLGWALAPTAALAQYSQTSQSIDGDLVPASPAPQASVPQQAPLPPVAQSQVQQQPLPPVQSGPYAGQASYPPQGTYQTQSPYASQGTYSPQAPATQSPYSPQGSYPGPGPYPPQQGAYGAPYAAQPTYAPAPAPTTQNGVPRGADATYHQDDLIGAAEGVFGKGAHGLAEIIQDILKKQGEPNGYITGREGGGALVVGLRYGSGTLFHKVEGQRPVYWTGPSVGFDAGANAAKTFVLVYNLYNTEDIYHRYGAGEGQAYLVGGFNVSYLRRGDVVLIPVRMGVGLRLGVNGGYMKFSKKQNWVPF